MRLKNVYPFGYGMKSMRPIFKTKMLVFHPNANLDEEILFGKVTHFKDPTIRKMSVMGL